MLVLILVSYNRFVTGRQLIRNSWSNVDTELRRRHDLVPNLVTVVRTYAAHERAVMAEVTEARTTARAAGTVADRERAEVSVAEALGRLLAVAENYPRLRASENFLELQKELAITEDRIQAARRFYNANVADNNRRVAAFPSMLIARLCGFAEEPYFEAEIGIA